MKNSKKCGIAVFLILVGAYFYIAQPFKITDPSNPKFNPEKFRFEDYSSSTDLGLAIATILPNGTSKEKVDKFFLSRGVMDKPDRGQKNQYIYLYEPSWFSIYTLIPIADGKVTIAILYNDQGQKVLQSVSSGNGF